MIADDRRNHIYGRGIPEIGDTIWYGGLQWLVRTLSLQDVARTDLRVRCGVVAVRGDEVAGPIDLTWSVHAPTRAADLEALYGPLASSGP